MTTYSDDIKAKLDADWSHGSITITVLQWPNDNLHAGGSYDLESPWSLPSTILTTNKVVIIINDCKEERLDYTDDADIGDGRATIGVFAISEANLDASLGELDDIGKATYDSNFKINNPQINNFEHKWFAMAELKWQRTVT